MNRDFEEIKRKTFLGVSWKFLERILAQVITFIVSLVLARILSPNEYGLIAIVTIMINLMNVFVTSGYGAALIQKKDASDWDFNAMFTFSGGLSLVLYWVLFFAAPYLAGLYKNESLTLLIRVMGLRLPLASFNSIQNAYIAKKMEYRKFFWATLGGTIASGVVGIIMALTGCGVWALVGQYFTNTLVDSIVLYVTFPWRYKPYFSGKLAFPMIRYGSGVLLASLVDAIYQELRALVVGIKYDAESLAYYNRGDQFPKLIALNLATAIDGTLLPAFSLLQDDTEKMQQGLKRSIQVSTVIISPLMFGMAAVAEPMIRLLLTDKWLPAVPYVQVFCIMYAMNPLISASNQLIKAKGASGLYLKIEIARKLAFIALLLVAMPFGPLAIAASSVLAMLFSCGINAVAVKKTIALPLRKFAMACVPQYLVAAVMAVAIWPLGRFIDNHLLLLLVQIFAGIFVFFSLMFLSKNEASSYLQNIFKKYVRREK